MADFMVALFTEGEIKEAVWDYGGDKAPGLDGFNFNFIKRYWDMLKEDVEEVMLFYHEGENISVGCSASFITLIPKIMDPLFIKDYRPISLIGCLYKILVNYVFVFSVRSGCFVILVPIFLIVYLFLIKLPFKKNAPINRVHTWVHVALDVWSFYFCIALRFFTYITNG